MIKVSLIVAAYNIEHYIQRCIKTLISQTMNEIEIIIVNDGSTDNTRMKIDEVSAGDPRIHVINQMNEGVMRAREVGYEKSIGEYVLFVDGDDWLSEHAIEIVYKKAKEKHYDIVCFKFFHADGQRITKSSKQQMENKLYSGDAFLKAVMTGQIMPSLWSKLIKRDFIVLHDPVFPNGIAKAQDLAFSCSLGIHFPDVCYIDEYLYFYDITRRSSVTNTVSSIMLDVEKATRFIRRRLMSHHMFDNYKAEFEYLAYTHNFNIEMIYLNRSKFSRRLFKSWRALEVDIKRNRYFKDLLKKKSFKVRTILKMEVNNYFLALIFYKLYGIYDLFIKRSRVV